MKDTEDRFVAVAARLVTSGMCGALPSRERQRMVTPHDFHRPVSKRVFRTCNPHQAPNPNLQILYKPIVTDALASSQYEAKENTCQSDQWQSP